MRSGIDDVARAKVFDARLATCEGHVQRIMDFLRAASAHAGDAVGAPTFEVRGVGVSYWASGKWFCRLDPKRKHVWVHLPDGDRRALAKLGTVAEREDGVWLTIQHMTQAVRLVSEILKAHDNAMTVASKRRTQ